MGMAAIASTIAPGPQNELDDPHQRLGAKGHATFPPGPPARPFRGGQSGRGCGIQRQERPVDMDMPVTTEELTRLDMLMYSDDANVRFLCGIVRRFVGF